MDSPQELLLNALSVAEKRVWDSTEAALLPCNSPGLARLSETNLHGTGFANLVSHSPQRIPNT